MKGKTALNHLLYHFPSVRCLHTVNVVQRSLSRMDGMCSRNADLRPLWAMQVSAPSSAVVGAVDVVHPRETLVKSNATYPSMPPVPLYYLRQLLELLVLLHASHLVNSGCSSKPADVARSSATGRWASLVVVGEEQRRAAAMQRPRQWLR